MAVELGFTVAMNQSIKQAAVKLIWNWQERKRLSVFQRSGEFH